MRFEQPLWLLGALPVLAACWLALREGRSRRASLPFPDAGSLSPVPGARLYRAAPAALETLALLLCVAALARPQAVRRQLAGAGQGIDIMLVLDTSESMRALDFAPSNRMEAAKQAARRFISGRLSDRIGLVVFGGAAVLACPPTLDYEALYEYLDAVEPGMTRVDGTAIGDAVASAAGHLQSGSGKSKVMILLTDGASNAGAVDPVSAAQAAKSLGARIYAIGTAERGPALVPVDTPLGRQLQRIPDELDEQTLARVAAEADGRYFRATNARELERVYAEIDRLEKSEAPRPGVAALRDLYPWLLVPAALLLALEMALSATLLLRIP